MNGRIVRNHPILSYFLIVYGLTWSGILLIASPKIASDTPLGFPEVGMMYLCMLLVPSLTGIALNRLAYGKSGFQDLISRISKIRNGFEWYLYAILTTPILLLIVLLSLSFTVSKSYLPGFQGIGILLGFAAGFFEEIGWSGFALPALQKRFKLIPAGLILGVMWGLWHLLADYLGASATLGSTWFPIFFFRYLLALVAYRVLMVWVYSKTRSVFIMQLMHGCFSGSLYLLGPVSSNENAMVWNGIFASVLWIFTLFTVLRDGRRIPQQEAIV